MTTYPHNMSGAYALDALSDAEREAFEVHLAECEDCADEVDGFIATSALLGTAAEEQVPPALKAKIMGAVAHTPQQRPVVTQLHRSRFRQVATRVALVAAALAVIASVGAVVVERNHSSDLQAEQARISQVLSAEDMAARQSDLPNGGSVRVVRSSSLGKAVLVTRDLPKLDPDHAYQVWTLASGKPTSKGLLSGTVQDGSSTRLLRGVSPSSAIAITVEPAGGSKAPTTRPIATLAPA